MFLKIIKLFSKNNFVKKIKINKFLEDIPEEFILEKYNITKLNLNGIIIIISLLSSTLISSFIFIFDIIFALIVFIMIFLLVLLFLIRKIRKDFLEIATQVEQYSALICNEILLIISITNSTTTAIEFIANGTYPILSNLSRRILIKLNLGYNQIELIKEFALNQPSETLKEFFLDYIIPVTLGEIKLKEEFNFDSQWRLRNKFEAYSSQLEGKMSLFLAITTIIPLTISMLLIMLGYINFNLILFLPLIFLIFDLIAVEIYNNGRIELLGGK